MATTLKLAGAAVAAALVAATAAGAAPPALQGTALDPPLRAANFSLRDQAGHTVSLAPERGRYTVVAFLYTHCPDVCPLIAEQLNTALRRLGPARTELRVLAVSVDPKGDTHAAVQRFVRVHRLLPQFRYLTGTRKQLAPVWAAYHVASTPGPKGTVSHSAFELLVDPSGKSRVLYDSQVKAADVVHDLAVLQGRR